MSRKFLTMVTRLDRMISRRTTGSPAELAMKMRISLRSVHNYIAFMKKSGAPITYKKRIRSYSYEEAGYFYFGFVKKDADMKNAT